LFWSSRFVSSYDARLRAPVSEDITVAGFGEENGSFEKVTDMRRDRRHLSLLEAMMVALAGKALRLHRGVHIQSPDAFTACAIASGNLDPQDGLQLPRRSTDHAF
jgi:hypothetical protein